MKTSLMIISTLLILSVFVPFLLFVYNGAKNSSSTKKQAKSITKNNGITYKAEEVWRKNFIGISNDDKTLTYINLKLAKPFISSVSLLDLKQCHVIKDYNKGANKVVSLKSVDLELIYKSSATPNVVINFFDIDEDLAEDFEIQRIEKWQALVKNAIPQPQAVKIAS